MRFSDKHHSENRISGSREGQRPLVIGVEGNIGSGKSTFLRYCSSKPGFDVFPEPVDEWQNVNGENLLAKYYSDPQRWAVPFQLQVGMTMLDIYKRESHKAVKLVERSLLSSRHCFLENMRRTGIVDPTSFTILEGWYDRVNMDIESRPHAIVYLHTTPVVAHERLIRRERREETGVGLEYITALHQLHEEWLRREKDAKRSGDSNMPIHIINANLSQELMYQQYEECLHFFDLLLA